MAAKIIDGKAISAQIRGELTQEVAKLKPETGRDPRPGGRPRGRGPRLQGLRRRKEKGCAELGLLSRKYALPATTPRPSCSRWSRSSTTDPEIHGILVQLPLPKQIDENKVIAAIDPDKDVDGFHPVNVGRLVIGTDGFRPCTPYGCIHLLERSGVKLAGAEVVVVGRSNIVGKPMALLLLQSSATVTVCHSGRRTSARSAAAPTCWSSRSAGRSSSPPTWSSPARSSSTSASTASPDGKLCGDVDFAASRRRPRRSPRSPAAWGR